MIAVRQVYEQQVAAAMLEAMFKQVRKNDEGAECNYNNINNNR